VLVVMLLVACTGTGGWAWSTRPRGNPQAIEFTEAELSTSLTEATVLGLGEATHGNAEFQQLRRQLVDALPQFHAVVLEDDYGAVARVNAYVQGGPGTATEAAGRFGFAINRTAEMAELLRWLREHNAERPPSERIELVGMDVQRYEASKRLALDGLTAVDPTLATELEGDLARLTDDPSAGRYAEAAIPALDRLVAALEEAGDSRLQVARNAARALRQGAELDAVGSAAYAPTRAGIMFDNLRRTVIEQRRRGNAHTLVLGHNGHLDRTSAAYPEDDLGALAAEHWGEQYRVIGTEFVRSTFVTGARKERWQVGLTRRTPLRGMFAGTAVGYLEFAAADATNRRVLAEPVRMSSAGERFQQWQAWLPQLNSVRRVPIDSYDALIMVTRATPVTPL
jgi:erythromycin esterase